FAARADTPFGRFGSMVLLSGIWNSQTVPRGYGGAGSFFWLLVVACALAGYLLQASRQRGWRGLGLAGIIGLAVAAIGVTAPTRAMLSWLVTAWPGFAVLRDGQQFVAALALLEAVGVGAGIVWLLERPASVGSAAAGSVSERSASVRSASRRRGRLPAPTTAGTAPGAVVVAVLAMLAPVVLLPGLAWGLAGRYRPVEYPSQWLTARRLIDNSGLQGSVLLLPWAAYRRYPWNDGEAVYDPWSKLLAREVIANDGLTVGSQTLTQESAASIRLDPIVTAAGPLTRRLHAAGVRYVVIDAGPLLGKPPAKLAGDARLPGARVLLASRDLVVFLIPGS
ncbi:MAG: hypothetical protein ACLQFR_08120, partial [Streptosporangiaceae bacterium]